MSFLRKLLRLPPKQVSAADQIGLEILNNWQEVRVVRIGKEYFFSERKYVEIEFRGGTFLFMPVETYGVSVQRPPAAQNMSGRIAGRIRERVLNERHIEDQAVIDASAKALLAKLRGGAQ
ncbi:hypothetical protein [Devosia salina]|uniref:Uncharacterized protein n=1 Tax=Devosia salina TaxID=2860336 RepID=A0ABX8WKU5_9HYPH|nr:hypothetical protein [Devosia salina]QYO78399.1 hypothetical protein K1X15_07590 [Devosia salina]